MEYDDFIAGYRTGTVRFGVDRRRIRKAVDNKLYGHLFDACNYPRLLNRLATVFSLLIVPALLTALIAPFFISWWASFLSVALAWVFWRLSYRYQREAVRELALANPTAYKFLLLEGIIVVDKPAQSSG